MEILLQTTYAPLLGLKTVEVEGMIKQISITLYKRKYPGLPIPMSSASFTSSQHMTTSSSIVYLFGLFELCLMGIVIEMTQLSSKVA